MVLTQAGFCVLQAFCAWMSSLLESKTGHNFLQSKEGSLVQHARVHLRPATASSSLATLLLPSVAGNTGLWQAALAKAHPSVHTAESVVYFERCVGHRCLTMVAQKRYCVCICRHSQCLRNILAKAPFKMHGSGK